MKAFKKFQDLPFRTNLFILLALTITLVYGTVFGVAHLIYRQNATDPQVQLSEDMADYLSKGNGADLIVPKTEVDIAKSLVWFVMVFDDKGELISSNAKLDGQTPELPFGVLDHARKNAQNRVTWQPERGVRIASVITHYNGGSVLVGRSLRETETRIHMLAKKLFIAWVMTLAVVFAGTWFLLPKKSH